MTQTRSVFFVSDGTGITAETLGHSLLAQFPDTRFKPHRMPFVDSPDKARDCAMKIRDAAVETGLRPIVFNTLVDPDAVAGLRPQTQAVLSVHRGRQQLELTVRVAQRPKARTARGAPGSGR